MRVTRKPPRMPDSVMLTGRRFALAVGTERAMGKETLGWYRPKSGTILVAAGMSDDQTKATVLHEMFHDFDAQSAYDLSEAQVNSLAALMFAALRDNPALVAWMMDRGQR